MSTSQKTMCLVLMMCKSLLSRLSRVQAFHFEPNFSYILSVSSCALCPAPSKKNRDARGIIIACMHTTPQPPLHTHPHQDMIPALSLCEVRPPPHFFFFCLSVKQTTRGRVAVFGLFCMFSAVAAAAASSSSKQQQKQKQPALRKLERGGGAQPFLLASACRMGVGQDIRVGAGAIA